MNKTLSAAFAASFLLSGSIASANEDCAVALVCWKASSIAEGVSKELPIQQGANMALTEVTAENETLNIQASLSYDRAYLVGLSKKNGIPLSQVKQGMMSNTKRLCDDKAGLLYKFVNMGGKINYVYQFSDGEHFADMLVDKCT